MTHRERFNPRWLVLLCVALAAQLSLSVVGPAGADEPSAEVRVALLSYDGGKLPECFANGFLELVAREAELPVRRTLDEVELASEALFDYPFVVLAGEGAFELSAVERANLETYIEQGGFVLASAACSNAEWSADFQREMAALFGEQALEPIDREHAIFNMLYEIERVELRRAMPEPVEPLLGRSVDGVLRVVFSPVGLNDTDHAGGGCCCCGGNEVRNARLINANLLSYALTH